MEFVLPVLLGLLGISFLILFHEIGHFLAALYFDMTVATFSVGFGKPLISFMHRGVQYQISRWFLLGGFVHILGHSLSEQDALDDVETLLAERGEQHSARYNKRKGWYRNKHGFAQLCTTLAGPIFSLLLGILLLSGYYKVSGLTTYFAPLTFEAPIEVVESSTLIPQEGDILSSLATIEYPSFPEAFDVFNRALQEKESIPLEVERNEEIVQGMLVLDDTSRLSFKRKVSSLSLGASFQIGVKEGISLFSGNLKSYGQLFTGQQSTNEVVGPLGILKVGAGVIRSSHTLALRFFAIISIALAAVNLLPLPVLDGGHALFAVWKILTGRHVPARVGNALLSFSMYLLIGAALFALANDIIGIITGRL